ncbi:MAG: HNH endonuclease signature motif containing protein [Ornithinimicrobium sp.]
MTWEPGGDYDDDQDFDFPDMSARDWEELSRTTAILGALDQVDHGLSRLPLPASVSRALMALLACAAGHSPDAQSPTAAAEDLSDQELLDASGAAPVIQGFADGVMVQAVRSLAERAGQELLGRSNVSRPGELSESGRERWRAKTKSVVAQELATFTGLGVQACHARVGFALAPAVVIRPVESALSRGATGWRAVAEFWQRCRSMDVEAAATVAAAVFGSDPAGDAAVEGADDSMPDDSMTGDRRESWPEFHRRLSREVVRVEGADAEAARRRRKAAVSTRNVSAEICDDGLGSLTITAGTARAVAAMERIETVARRARKAGDPRSLGHLRSDSAMALLIHGTLPLSDSPTDRQAEPLVPTTAQIQRIVSAVPHASVDVIVPMSALVASQQEEHKAGTERDGSSGCDGAQSCMTDIPVSASGQSVNSASVAEIPGYGFISGEHARELAADSSAMWHGLLTDLVDGRAVHRSREGYRPDRAMVEQVRAMDRFCRAPGCLVPAHRCELDHEHPFGTPGGLTSAANLNAKHSGHHQLKTDRFWASVMDETRHVTWTTLFGKVYRTGPHDYRQYDDYRHFDTGPAQGNDMGPAQGNDTGPTQGNDTGPVPVNDDFTRVDDPDLRDQLVYAALSSRGAGDRWLEAIDDYDGAPGAEVGGRPLRVFHRRDGRRRWGTPVAQSSPEELMTPEALPTPSAKQPPPPPF